MILSLTYLITCRLLLSLNVLLTHLMNAGQNSLRSSDCGTWDHADIGGYHNSTKLYLQSILAELHHHEADTHHFVVSIGS